VGNCIIGGTDGDAVDIDNLDPCVCKVHAGSGWRMVLTTAAAEDGMADPGLISWVVCPVECIDVAEVICWGLNMATPAGKGVN